MKIVETLFIALAAGMLVPLAAAAQPGAGAQDRERDRLQAPADDDDGTGRPVYGRQLMTQQELEQHRARMRAAKTEQERERIRAEHHKMMLERARERGVTLPEEPPKRRGPGEGPGPG